MSDLTWLPVVEFFVPGLPRPGGSKRAFVLRRKGGAIITRANGSPIVNVTDAGGEKTAFWRQSVAFAAREHYGRQEPLRGPLRVTFAFVVARPKSHFRRSGALKPDAPIVVSSKPDGVKLTRSTEDALTGIVWHDDALIADHVITRRYGPTPGVQITVERLEMPVSLATTQTEEAPLWA